ncbi:MAG: DUF1643 domain-containing protein [Gammaproteobacteria bacterium]|nr:DUF1643 domain-containing protein [Gammaproteobacteria bacterium]MYL13542.1 DUF1643 domain-containing protein [Gammaproteobacteria bacterium]
MNPIDKVLNLAPMGACLSDCRNFRYTLTRDLNHTTKRPMLICGYNPSTADEIKDDHTMRREIKFADNLAQKMGTPHKLEIPHCEWF